MSRHVTRQRLPGTSHGRLPGGGYPTRIMVSYPAQVTGHAMAYHLRLVSRRLANWAL
jgi:hypothetical protein